jgi:hypothetical protein
MTSPELDDGKTRYYVLNEHTLGFVFPHQPHLLSVLAGSVLKGSQYNPLNGPVAIVPGHDQLRPATRADFEEFRVCHKGHLPEEDEAGMDPSP